MAVHDELERALRASWNTGDLAVYADHLQALGDPRGELISLDLAPSDDRAWRKRRRAVLEAWLGPELAASAGRLVQHGVIHELRDGYHPPGLLDGPLGAVVRGISIGRFSEPSGPSTPVLEVLERLAAHPRPWLTRLAIEYAGDTRCDPALCDRLIAATPNLVELYTLGERLFDSFRHPSLRRLHATPAFQRAQARGIPDTGAEVIELFHYGYAATWFARDSDLAVATLLEAIETTADCNELYATYGDLVEDHDSMPAVLMRLDEAGLVTLDGPFVRPTAVGRGLLRWPLVRDRSPPRVPPDDLDNRKWVLWAFDADSDDSVVVGRLSRHCKLLVTCLERMPLEESTHDALRGYLAFLGDVVRAGEWTDVAFAADLGGLVAALRSLLGFHRLTDYFIQGFDRVGNDTQWSYLEQLVQLLEPLQGARFRVAWGL